MAGELAAHAGSPTALPARARSMAAWPETRAGETDDGRIVTTRRSARISRSPPGGASSADPRNPRGPP
eukprot:8536814-Pyramimonas_sp.AAC.1